MLQAVVGIATCCQRRRVRGVCQLIVVTVFLLGAADIGIAQAPEHGTSTTSTGASRLIQSKGTSQETKTSNSSRVSLEMENATVHIVLRSLAQQSGKAVVWNTSDPRFAKKISVSIKDETFARAMAIVLQRAGLTSMMAADGETIMIRAKSDSVPTAMNANEVGIISGQVIDSATTKGIVGATVVARYSRMTLVSSENGIVQKLVPFGKPETVVTGEQGRFALRSAPAGPQRLEVRAFGFKAAAVSVDVIPGQVTTSTIVLGPMANQLSEVVTTVTGEQRKIEIGNDITSIQVEDVIQKNPVSNVSELLATRVPGLYAAPVSGQPGAPTRIRIRGVSSVNASNEPIIVVDGVRIRSEGTTRMGQSGVGFDFSSLDQIDVNAIETVEVLKGPSAVALYGSDAANGVIVITSKRGKAGPARWNASTRFAVDYMPGRWPDNYYSWGTSKIIGGPAIECFHNAWIGSQGCRPDSMTVYQVLNDPRTTVLGRGHKQEYSVGVNGGSRDITYSLTASAQRTLGLIKMPDADRQALRASNVAVPFWQQRPESAERTAGSAIIRMEPVRETSVELMTTMSKTSARSTPLKGALNVAATLPPSQIRLTDGLDLKNSILQGIRKFREQQTQAETGYRNALSLQSRAIPAVTGLLSVGLDNRIMDSRSFLRHGDLYREGYVGPLDSGELSQIHTSASTVDINSNISMRPVGHRLLNIIPSAGINFIRNTESSVLSTANRLQRGAIGFSGALNGSTGDNISTRNTFGSYMEVRINVADRFWLPLSFRSDVGNALGGNVLSGFPKLSFSYLLSEQPAFRELPILGTLPLFRIRTAYGAAGKQPDMAAKYRTYQPIDGTREFGLYSLGNTRLRPERSQELELGFDSDVIENSHHRLSVSMTWSTKKTRDLLIQEFSSFSIGGIPQWKNLGDTRNSTFELSIEGLLQQQWLSWQPTFNLSTLRNRLVALGALNTPRGTGLPVIGVQDLHVVGYPLYGRWAKELVGYADRNGDGFIDGSEVAYSDSAVFLGAPYPKFTASTQQQFTLLSNVTVTGVMNYEHGLTQINPGGTYPRVNADPDLSLREQAYGLYSVRTRVQQVSTLRLVSAQVTYIVPQRLTKTVLGPRSASIAIAGTNLGLWTTYRGKDPNVGATGERIFDYGQLPTPRSWGLTMRIN